MAGLVPAIHAFNLRKDVDARHKAGHDKQSVPSGRSEAEGSPLTHCETLDCHPRAGGIHKR